jgi:hypothetical protein
MKTANFRCVTYDRRGQSTLVVVGFRDRIEKLARAAIRAQRITHYGDRPGRRPGFAVELLVIEEWVRNEWLPVAVFQPPFRPRDPLHWLDKDLPGVPPKLAPQRKGTPRGRLPSHRSAA